MRGLADLSLAAAAAAALVALLQVLLPETSWRRLAGWAGLALLLFAPILATRLTQVPIDYTASFAPWNGPPPQNPLLTDVATQMLPFRHLVRDRLVRGHAPLWAAEIGTGSPLLENPQAAVFAPLHLLALPLPPIRAMTVAVALQVFLFLAFGDALARSYGASSQAGALAAVAMGLSSFSVAWSYYPHGMTAAFVPGFLLAVRRLALGAPRARALALVTGVGLGTAGQPQIALFAALTAVPLWLASLEPRSRTGLSRRAGGTAATALLLAGLLAPMWLPTLAYLPHSERALLADSDPEALHPKVQAAQAWGLVADPLAYGSPRDGNWSGQWNFNETATLWAGALTLALATAGLLAGAITTRLVVGGGVLALLIATRTGPLTEWLHRLPLLADSTTGRFSLLWVIALSIAAALTLDRVDHEPRVRRVALGVCVLATLPLLAWPDHQTTWQWIWRALALATLLAAVLQLARGRSIRRWAAIAVGLELVSLGWRYYPVVDEDLLEALPILGQLAETAASGSGPGRVTALGGRLIPSAHVLFGLSDPRGFDPLRPALPQQLMRERLHRPSKHGQLMIRRPLQDAPLLEFLGVRGLLAGADEAPAGWTTSGRSPGPLVIHLPPNPPSLVHSPQTIGTLPNRQQAFDAALREPRLDQRVMLDGEDPACEPMLQAPPAATRILHVEGQPSGFDLEIESEGPGIVGSSISWLPGWVVDSADGARVCRSWGAFVALRVAPGRSVIHLRYQPRGLRLGLLLCGSSLLVLLAFAWRGRVGS